MSRSIVNTVLAGLVLGAPILQASAQTVLEPINGFAGHVYIDYITGHQATQAPPASGRDVYSSTGMPQADWGWSSPDTWVEIGDWGACTAPGLLHENDFTIYNGAASTSPVTSLTMTIRIYNELFSNYGPTSPNAQYIGTYSVNLTFPGGIAPGWYTLVTVTNLDAVGINLPPSTTGSPSVPARILQIQTASNVIGGSRIGFANNSTVTLGSSGQSLYLRDTTHPGSFLFLNNPQTYSNPGIRLNVCTAPAILSQPPNQTSCAAGTAAFSVAASGGPLTYLWQIQTAPNTWATLGHDPLPLPCGGIAFAQPPNTAATGIGVRDCPGSFQVRAIVSDACGSITSNPATLTICAADIDDGSGTGACDGGVTIDDLLFYLTLFSAGDARGDVDDGSGTGVPDGGVTIDDLLYYLARFAAGC